MPPPSYAWVLGNSDQQLSIKQQGKVWGGKESNENKPRRVQQVCSRERAGAGGNNTGEKEKARAGPSMPGDTDTSAASQDCKDAVSDGSGLQRRFWKLPGLPTLLCGSSHRREMLTSLQPLCSLPCARVLLPGLRGRRARVTPRAGGACELLLEATIGSPCPHRSQRPRVRLHRGQHGAALPRLQTAVPLPCSPGVACVTRRGRRGRVSRNEPHTHVPALRTTLLDFKRSCF